MDYFEAESIVKDSGLYNSPDFYRMQFSDSIALGLRDQPIQILGDVHLHGSDEARALLKECVENGLVTEEFAHGHIYYDVIDKNPSLGYYFRSHVAMQIAYPDIYRKHFGGELVWEYDHRMKELLMLNISCLTNHKHPSDYYGQHQIPDETPKQGRPQSKPNQEKSLSHGNWIEACQAHKKQLKKAWEDYISVCQERKEKEKEAKLWRDSELDKARELMKSISDQYEQGMQIFADKVKAAKQRHSDIKIQAPKRTDF